MSWIKPNVGQIWKDVDRDKLFVIVEIKDCGSSPIRVLTNNGDGAFSERISSRMYSEIYLKNLCEYQGVSKVSIDDLYVIKEEEK